MKKRLVGIIAMISLTLFIAACGGGGGGTDTAVSGSTGELSVGLMDATSNDYQAVYITVSKVSVSQRPVSDTEDADADDAWITVAEPNVTVNLLELVNGVIEPLFLGELAAGDYTQMRLLMGYEPDEGKNILGEEHPHANYIIYGDEIDPEYFPLTIPSGFQTGIKIVNGFNIKEGEEKQLVLDFDVMDSIVRAGNSGQWFLKPTIKAMEPEGSAELTGTVFDSTGTEEDPIVIEGAIISAQNGMGGINSDTVSASTISDETGGYSLLLKPGDYTIVAIKEGYYSASAGVKVAENDAAPQDFYLEPAEKSGTIYGKVEIHNGLDDQSATVKIFNQEDEQVASISVANGGTYWFDLPPGLYSMLAVFTVGDEEMTMEALDGFEISDGGVIEFDILFENPETEEGDGVGNTNKVTICHKGRTITISESALPAHLAHGDTIGACDAVQ